jgi:tellurite resistance protein TerC
MGIEVAGLAALIVAFLLVDFVYFGRHGEPSFAEATRWSIFWFVLSLAVTPVMLALHGSADAIDYTTVYLIERSLSLDNLFVFLLLFTYFAVPQERRGGLLFWGIVLALALRGLAILAGTELIEQFHWFLYVLGVGLLILAWRVYQGVDETPDPDQTLAVRLARRIKRDASPLTLALLAMVFADITFAIDSIPAAFAITTDSFVIWTANAFALLGMRALFVLVEGLIERFRYLGQTIAVVLGIIAVKLLIEDLVKVSAPVSLAIVVVAFAVGITLSLVADRRDEAETGA